MKRMELIEDSESKTKDTTLLNEYLKYVKNCDIDENGDSYAFSYEEWYSYSNKKRP